MAPVRRPRASRPQPGGRGGPGSSAAGTRAAARRSERARGRVRRSRGRAGATGGRSGAALTTRAALLGLVVCALLVSAAVPMRQYLGQRSRISALEQQQAAQRDRVVALEERRRLLDDPAHIAAQARERLHMVRPGETAYRVLVPGRQAEAAPGSRLPTPAAEDEAPWYSRLLDGVRDADGDPGSDER